MFMMYKNKKVKNKIISLSSRDLLFSIDYEKKMNLDKLFDLNSKYNFLNKKNNDLLKIKIENEIISNSFLRIENVIDQTKNKFKFIALDFSYLFKKDVFKGRVSIIQKKENIIDIIFQLAVKWNNEIPKKTTFFLPIFSKNFKIMSSHIEL